MRMHSISTTVLLVAALAVGCGDQSSPTSPVSGDATPLVGLGGPNATGTVSEITLMSIPTAGVDGIGGNGDEGTLTRTAQAVEFEVDATNLVPGHAYTAWWIVFDKPQFCDGECGPPGPDDMANPKTRGSVFNGGGAVADESGEATFSNRLLRHETRPAGVGDGSVDNTLKAALHVVFKSHGIAETDPTELDIQLTTGGGHCNLPQPVPPELPDPTQGPPGCKDVGVLVFPTP